MKARVLGALATFDGRLEMSDALVIYSVYCMIGSCMGGAIYNLLGRPISVK